MKLLAKTSLIYILSTALVFLAGGLIFYYNLRAIVDEEATEHIYVEKDLIEKYVSKYGTVPPTPEIGSDFISIRQTSQPVKLFLRDTSLFSQEEEENLPYRVLTFPVKTPDHFYAVTVSKALFESDDLVEAILYSFISIIVVLLAAIFAVNRIASGRLWKPFMSTIRLLHNYKVDRHIPLQFESTSTSEFKELNAALAKMTEKIASDYNNLKTFTENASHELQTPLAVIMNSAELLLQQENLAEKQLEAIQRIHQTARKLSRLNQTLLLLAKIENRQFEEKENVDLGQLISSKLELFGELIAHKKISVNFEPEKDVLIHIHPALADVMISNLLTNAIRHNSTGGSIHIVLNKKSLVVCNSGEKKQLDARRLFDRFYKENPSAESTGLGLALVQQAAETNGMKVSYRYEKELHCFEILF